ncbi:glycoside hydrolase [candidate division KSB1 bacterium]|nr:glycoside hydrolase [candidate division KSB1 bacterium]
MKKVLFYIAWVGLFTAVYGASSAEKIITAIDSEMIGDHRLAIFDIELSEQDSMLVVKGETSVPAAHDTLIARLNRLVEYPVIDSVQVLPDPELGDRIYGIINVSTAHQRRIPDVRAEMVNQALMGETVKIFKNKGNYYLTQLPDGYIGWIMHESVTTKSLLEFNQWRQNEKVIFNRKYGVIHSEKDAGSLPVRDLTQGAILAKLAQEDEWILVLLPNGDRGYILASDVIDQDAFETQPPPTAEEIIKTAKEFMGTPYLWGGRSTKGVDCSGFTNLVFRFNGIELPRDANMQVQTGTKVAIDSDYGNLKTGDLLFFGPHSQRITHVAIYIGDKQFIHSDGIVRINSFNPDDKNYSEYRARHLQAVRRVF